MATHEHYGVDPAVCVACSADPETLVWVSIGFRAGVYHRIRNCEALYAGQRKVAAEGGDPAPVELVRRDSELANGKPPCSGCWVEPHESRPPWNYPPYLHSADPDST